MAPETSSGSIVRIQALGGLGGTAHGIALEWLASQWQRAALLVHLALERSATRDQLQVLFWPECDAETAGHRLSQTIYGLRQALGTDVLETRGRAVRIADHVVADAVEFESAFERGDFAAAISAYSGPFLAGVHLAETNEFQTWVANRRARYARLFRQACRARSDELIAQNDLAGALDIARKWIAPDPLDDEAQHRLIELLARTGQRTEALREYESYAARLESEGLEPLDQTVSLIAALERDTTTPAAAPIQPPFPAREPVSETPSAVQPAQLNAHAIPQKPKRRLRPAAALSLIAALGLAAFGIWKMVPAAKQPADRLAVARFANETGVDSLETFGVMLAVMLTDGLTRTGLLDVAPTAASAQRTGAPELERIRALAQDVGANLVLFGTYFLRSDSLVVQPQLIDVSGTRVPVAMAHVTVAASDHTGAVRGVLNRALIALSSQLDARLADQAAHSDLPVSLAGYSEFAAGVERYWAGDPIRALPHFYRAMELDPSAAAPPIWAAFSEWFAYANMPKVDSLLRLVENRSGDLTHHDVVLVQWLRAWVNGDLVSAARTSNQWAEIGGGFAQVEAAYDALRLNRIDEADTRIEATLANPPNRKLAFGWDVRTMVDHQRQQHERELGNARLAIAQNSESPYFLLFEVRALGALGRADELRARLETLQAIPTAFFLPARGYTNAFVFREAIRELMFHGHESAAQTIGADVTKWLRAAYERTEARGVGIQLAAVLYDLQRWNEARALFDSLSALLSSNRYSWDRYWSYDLEALGYLGIDAARRGDTAGAEQIIDQLDAVDRPYMFGSNRHWQARIAARLGQCERAVAFLEEGLRRGAAYWQWGGGPLLRELPEFRQNDCPA
ncbi:MAG TPA: BTAD domain-containing putative transcriptional regulator, partial [Longimicrobiales bacterium]|nr:BTAD domain-containing putative transcriptional regulator [Longimicrobiales bacterium]